MTVNLLDPNIQLKILIIDSEGTSADRLSGALSRIRTRRGPVIENATVESIPEAYEALSTYAPNTIFIDVISAELRDSTSFIQHVRLKHPSIVFVLYCSEHLMSLHSDELYEGWGSRLRHYFLLNKESSDDEFDRLVFFNLMRVQLDLSAYGVQESLSWARTSEAGNVYTKVQLSKLGSQFTYLSRELSSISRRNVGEAAHRTGLRVFVIMAFTKELQDIYVVGIKEHLTTKFGLEVVRADEIFPKGLIIHQIYEEIHNSTVIIADLTDPRPNCYYELGFADALGKPVIRIARLGTQLPFDVNQYAFIFYENLVHLRNRLAAALTELGIHPRG